MKNERNFDRAEAADDQEIAQALPATIVRGKPRARKVGFALLGGTALLAAAGYGALVLLSPPSVETDDAYVGGDIVSITAREGGTVLALHADNTQQVRQGAPLIDLDPATEDVALASAEAELGRTVRDFRSQNAAVDEASAEILQARADLGKAQDDLTRRRAAAAEGAVSGEEVSHANDALQVSRANLTLAAAKRAQAASAVQGTSVYDNPAVLAAITNVRRAAISRAYMHIQAPVGGIVAQRTVQLGQRVAPGTPLMAVVPINALWVDANFRETQLKDLRVGQPASIRTDIYGKSVTFHGKVLGLGAGSGNAFALLPPQNASGNWIKIVQRVPVRIALNPSELEKTPLRIGLSVDVKVATGDKSGALVGGARAPSGGVQQSIDGGPAVETQIRRIIAQNMVSGR
ncbi:MAG TPA: efflux RND transporter periplasmic adaptor subunit [Sphingomonas sp.]|uniref:efflux RND transporter periplasmic adaptor subunit n=1 Tax=Sphingomonas sp. TaxID=28214 RepID=UPI002CC42F4E|nr:efflux RND transporter periplasmic adaptor subunit [Sphingomonas sp.]HMI20450.1 efflux RND transporter periplasmic adaptor subunit [Sphingomonas sp.]